ncbi:hypothetical protein AYI70_g2495 [Smittium culicis]|uniref:Uncharacterized protein n=1 Tax=Smittium culicis TaxID=133412 RepID=A0A1R1Y847_9FUNG|nr:hypothetical protein AYI70_g2495 [Smittium culicis]
MSYGNRVLCKVFFEFVAAKHHACGEVDAKHDSRGYASIETQEAVVLVDVFCCTKHAGIGWSALHLELRLHLDADHLDRLLVVLVPALEQFLREPRNTKPTPPVRHLPYCYRADSPVQPAYALLLKHVARHREQPHRRVRLRKAPHHPAHEPGRRIARMHLRHHQILHRRTRKQQYAALRARLNHRPRPQSLFWPLFAAICVFTTSNGCPNVDTSNVWIAAPSSKFLPDIPPFDFFFPSGFATAAAPETGSDIAFRFAVQNVGMLRPAGNRFAQNVVQRVPLAASATDPSTSAGHNAAFWLRASGCPIFVDAGAAICPQSYSCSALFKSVHCRCIPICPRTYHKLCQTLHSAPQPFNHRKGLLFLTVFTTSALISSDKILAVLILSASSSVLIHSESENLSASPNTDIPAIRNSKSSASKSPAKIFTNLLVSELANLHKKLCIAPKRAESSCPTAPQSLATPHSLEMTDDIYKSSSLPSTFPIKTPPRWTAFRILAINSIPKPLSTASSEFISSIAQFKSSSLTAIPLTILAARCLAINSSKYLIIEYIIDSTSPSSPICILARTCLSIPSSSVSSPTRLLIFTSTKYTTLPTISTEYL